MDTTKSILLVVLAFILIDCTTKTGNEIIPINTQIDSLLVKYSWTVNEKVSQIDLQLPNDFDFYTGDDPKEIYWALANVFSTNSEFDFNKFKSKNLKIHSFLLNEMLPDKFRPYKKVAYPQTPIN